MNADSKLTLSADELQLVTDARWILTKRMIMDKVNALLADVLIKQRAALATDGGFLPEAVRLSEPKIAKGENYRGLPYMILDYPRCFGSADIFAIRSMFWWGNFFSVTLHLAGCYKTMFQQKIIGNKALIAPDLFICIHEDQWQHHFGADNYVRIQTIGDNKLQALVQDKPFVKLAMQFPITAWSEMPRLLEQAFAEIITRLKD